jgi:DNA repair exonuclease SbcCD ATPase subunit
MTQMTRGKKINVSILLLSLMALPAISQEASPLEQTREQLRSWLETKQKEQTEINEWKNDQEVLTNYKEGLIKEIATYKQQIADAKILAGAADQESSNKITARDQFIAAEKLLSTELRKMEEEFATIIPLLPPPVARAAKISVGIETLKKNLALPIDAQAEDVAKRLANITELMAEAEKFQQGVNIFPELHKKTDGSEYNMQVVYFGLSIAYAVNEDSTFAMIGVPSETGWKFTEANELAADIQKLLVTATTEKDVSFTNLPISK